MFVCAGLDVNVENSCRKIGAVRCSGQQKQTERRRLGLNQGHDLAKLLQRTNDEKITA